MAVSLHYYGATLADRQARLESLLIDSSLPARTCAHLAHLLSTLHSPQSTPHTSHLSHLLFWCTLNVTQPCLPACLDLQGQGAGMSASAMSMAGMGW